MSVEPPRSNTTLHHSFSCGADGEHQGAIVGCCHICGQILCEAHIYYIPDSPQFGDVDDLAVSPLACKSHAGEDRRRGLPRERQLQPSKTNTASRRSQKITRRPKSKRPKPTGRRI